MAEYIVSFPNLDAALAKQHACIVSISVGGDAHEGDQFRATLKAVNAAGFKKCYIMVAGKLQRHTEQIAEPSLSDEAATELAIRKEQEWVDRNSPSFDELKIEYEVILWGNWLEHPDYQRKYGIIQNLYETQEGFQTAVDRAATQFNSSFVKQERIKVFKGQLAQRKSEEYVKEESAVILLWRALSDVRYIIYPIKNSPAHNFIFDCLKLVSNGMVSDMNCLEFVVMIVKEVKEAKKEIKKSDKPTAALTVIDGGRDDDAGPTSGTRLLNQRHVKSSSPPHDFFAAIVKSTVESDVSKERAADVILAVAARLGGNTLSALPRSPADDQPRSQNGIS